jgi:acyl carrier protein
MGSSNNHRPGSVFERVRRIVAELHGVPVLLVTAETPIFPEGGDSLDGIEVIMTLEELFEVEFPTVTSDSAEFGRIAGITTVGDLVVFIERQLPG